MNVSCRPLYTCMIQSLWSTPWRKLLSIELSIKLLGKKTRWSLVGVPGVYKPICPAAAANILPKTCHGWRAECPSGPLTVRTVNWGIESSKCKLGGEVVFYIWSRASELSVDYVASVSSVVLVFHGTAADSEEQRFVLHQCSVTDRRYCPTETRVQTWMCYSALRASHG